VSEAAQALSFGAHAVGEDFAEVNPDDGALRESKKSNVCDQEPDQQVVPASDGEDRGDSGEAR
jgi:hypothetical protein